MGRPISAISTPDRRPDQDAPRRFRGNREQQLLFQSTIMTPIGTLNRLAALRVTDSFGAQTLIPPTGELDPPNGPGKAWEMYTLAGDANRRDTLLLPPTLGRVIDGPFLEDVLFFRDDMAAMAWAIEQLLDGPLDTAISGFELQRAPTPCHAPPARH